jgi:hypothetical protein
MRCLGLVGAMIDGQTKGQYLNRPGKQYLRL